MPNPSHDCGSEYAGHERLTRKVPGCRSPAEIARDCFWAARAVGDRHAMIYWSARENLLRRAAHRAPPAVAPCPSWRGRDLPQLA